MLEVERTEQGMGGRREINEGVEGGERRRRVRMKFDSFGFVQCVLINPIQI